MGKEEKWIKVNPIYDASKTKEKEKDLYVKYVVV